LERWYAEVCPLLTRLDLILVDVLAKVLPRAGAHGVRVIAFHRRDYGTSSPFTEQEISPIRPKDDPSAVEAFMDARALEFAHLIRILIDRLNLPAAEHGHGGIAILGWSLGNMYGVDFLARATKLPQDLLAIVKKYIRSYVIFGSHFRRFRSP
jgi:pimeloyl-ACP methyl ester carboxylesterase